MNLFTHCLPHFPASSKVLKSLGLKRPWRPSKCISVLMREPLPHPHPRSCTCSAWKILRKRAFFSLCWLTFRYKPENLFCHLTGFFVAVVVKNKTKQKYLSPFLEDSRECQLDTKVWKSIVSDGSFLGTWWMTPWCTQAQLLGLSITGQPFPSIRNRQVIK